MGDKKDKKLRNLYDENSPVEEQVVALLRERELTLTTAESLTGGLIAATITSVPGASECFKQGFVTYSNKAKRRMLSVKKEILKKEGAVSELTAKEMAIGALMESEADISVSVTGNAGPEAMENKPVGLVYIGVCAKGKTKVEECRFSGNRKEIREQTVAEALRLVKKLIIDRFD